jgi:hypothetical protein
LSTRDSIGEIKGKINHKKICRNDLFSIIATLGNLFTGKEE